MSLIGAGDSFALWAVLFAIAGFAFWADHTEWGHKIGGVLVAIVAAMLLSNVRLIPTSAQAYDIVFDYFVPAAIPLLLMNANLRRIARVTGPMIGTFAIAAFGSALGAVIGLQFVDLGAEAPELAGIFTATYVGGSLNFAAVAKATGFDQSSLLAASVAADVLVNVLFLIALISLPAIRLVRRLIPSAIADEADRAFHEAKARDDGAVPFRPMMVCLAVGLSLAICALGFGLEAALGLDGYGILLISLFALVPANVFPRLTDKIAGHMEAGMIAIYVFLVAIGATADVSAVLGEALPITIFALILVSVHMVVILLAGWALKIDLAEIVIASSAAIGGSASAAPLAAGRRWHTLVTPAVMCGALGNAAATFLGVGIVRLMGG